MRILLIEDDLNFCETLRFQFEQEAYEVDVCHDGRDGLDLFLQDAHDIVLLDRMLPTMNGLLVLQKARQAGISTPVILITALGELYDRIEGLDAGADDYVTKPFGMMELISRIKAVLRRSANGSISSEDTFEIGEIRLNPKKHEVTVHGEVVNLTLKEYELLKRLMKNPNIVMTRDCLLEDIWGYDFDGETRTVDVHVRTLRQKLGKSGEKIETVRGVGYRMSE